MSDDVKPFRKPNWDIPMDVHFGEIGKTDLPDAMDDHDIDEEEEELPASDDVIAILGFDPAEEAEDEEPDDDEYQENK
jgi:hypothetical protein